VSVDPEQPAVQTRIYGTPHWVSCLGGKPVSNEYFNIFNDEICVCSLFSCEEEYRFTHCCDTYNLSRGAIIKRFNKPTMPTVSNFASSHTVFARLKVMSYVIRIDSWILGNLCYNHLADPYNLGNHDYTRFFNCNPVEWIEFLMQQPTFREHMSYAP